NVILFQMRVGVVGEARAMVAGERGILDHDHGRIRVALRHVAQRPRHEKVALKGSTGYPAPLRRAPIGAKKQKGNDAQNSDENDGSASNDSFMLIHGSRFLPDVGVLWR